MRIWGVLKVAGLLGALGISACACGTSDPVAAAATTPACQAGPTVTAHGRGTASGPPDLLTVQLTVQNRASSAAVALSANSANTQKLINQLKSDGIAPSDLKTTGLSLSPTRGNKGSITGYQASNSVTVQIHNLKTAGSVIDSAVRTSGNALQIDQFTFSVANSSSLFGQARAAAVAQAAVEANAMAAAAHEKLGRLCSLNDGSPTVVPLRTNYGLAAPSSAPTPVEPGVQQVQASVTAIYQLQP